MPPQKINAKAKGSAKAPPAKKSKVVVKQVSDDDEDEDDDDIDEDDIDEDVSLGSADEEDDLDGEEEEDDDDDDDEEEDDDDDGEEEKAMEKPAKRAKLDAVKKDTKKEETKKGKQEKPEAEPKAAKDFEDRASAVGPLTEAEREMFSANFRAMSETSVFVGKLPPDTTDEDLKKLHPSIRSIRRPVSRKGLPATFGFLNFANKEIADRALKEIKKKSVVKIRGQEVLVSENGNGQCHPPSTVDRRKLRIYGCPKFVTKDTIKKSLPGCVDVLLGDKDKGNAIEAVAVFKSSAETKKILLSQQTLTLNECVCALFYLNISHNVKQHERKKDRKQAIKQKLAEKKSKATSESDDQDDSDLPADKIVNFKKENVKPKVQSAKKGKKRTASEDDDDDDDEVQDEPKSKPAPTPKGKKVSLKSPQKTPVAAAKTAKKTPMRKGTPFKKAKTAA